MCEAEYRMVWLMADSPSQVGFARMRSATYPADPPFHPAELYSEYLFSSKYVSAQNDAYALVREAFANLQLDPGRAGQPDWNPLRGLVEPGQTVLLKPNLVLDRHPKGGDLACLITHGSVVRAVLDYVGLALQGRGRVIIGDSPLQGTDFDAATRAMGLPEIIDFYRQNTPLEVSLVDFRQVHAVMDNRFHVKEWKEVPGDPAGYVEIDLANGSMLAPIARDSHLFRVSNYKVSDTLQYHNERSHRYIVAGSVFDADVIFTLPKLKTHCKAGVTLALKNFVGTVGRKQCLAHHRHGGRLKGGDEYPDANLLKRLSVALEGVIDGHPNRLSREFLRFSYRINERLIKVLKINQLREGAWHGNDTVWRMVLDLVRIACYGRRDGSLADTPQRRVVTVVDGLTAGEGEGPLEATPQQVGCVIAGLNPVAADYVGAACMGYEPARIPLLREARKLSRWPLLDVPIEQVRVCTGAENYSLDAFAALAPGLPLLPPAGWVGHIEVGRGTEAPAS